jgi:4,5-dihydroxyphthalate decarboxylase
MHDRLTLTAAIGAKAWRESLPRAADGVSQFKLSFADVSPIHRAFAPMAREQAFDISEMAIVTALQALAHDKPLILLPVTLAARFQQGCMIAMRATGARALPTSVAELRGKRIGVRAYTQTTGVWLRGILQNDYGVPPETIQWITQEGAHLAEYVDPPWVAAAPPGASLPDLLRSGAIDAAILGNDLPDDDDFAPVIADPKAAATAWYEKHGVVPINHMLVVRRDIAAVHPDAISKLWRVIEAARPPQSSARDMAPIGIEANRRALDMVLRYCDQQRLLPRRLSVDGIFAEASALLG